MCVRDNPVTGVRYRPSREVKLPRKRRPLMLAELAQVMEALPAEWRLFFMLLAHTGVRIGEALARFFEEPERFNPERFSAGWEERIPRYAFLPFGGGPRVCIGNGFAMMEARLILATVVQRCQLSLEPGQDIVPMQLVTVRPRHGIRMRIGVREHASR